MRHSTTAALVYQEPELPGARDRRNRPVPLRPTALAPKRTLWSKPSDLQMDRNALFRELTPLVHRLVCQHGQDLQLRQDLTGEVYCRFCALLDAYDPSRGIPLRPYLVRQLSLTVYTYARHHRRLRKREVRLEEQTMPAALMVVDPISAWLESWSRQQVRAQLPHALSALPSRQRQVVLWRYYEERSFEDIAGMLGVQPATVRSLLRHGLTHLRKQLLANR